MVKQEMAELSTNISGISELKWKEWVNLIQITVISTAVAEINPFFIKIKPILLKFYVKINHLRNLSSFYETIYHIVHKIL